MNIHKMIAELQAEKERLDEAISALERLSAGKIKRRAKATPDEPKEVKEPESEHLAAAKARAQSN